MIIHSKALLFLSHTITFRFLAIIFRSLKLTFRPNGIAFRFLAKISVNYNVFYNPGLQAVECDSVYSDGQPFNLSYYYFIFIIIVIAISIIIIFIIIIIIMIFFIWSHSSTFSHLCLCAPFLSETSCQRKEFAPIKQMFSPEQARQESPCWGIKQDVRTVFYSCKSGRKLLWCTHTPEWLLCQLSRLNLLAFADPKFSWLLYL